MALILRILSVLNSNGVFWLSFCFHWVKSFQRPLEDAILGGGGGGYLFLGALVRAGQQPERSNRGRIWVLSHGFSVPDRGEIIGKRGEIFSGILIFESGHSIGPAGAADSKVMLGLVLSQVSNARSGAPTLGQIENA
jgi:hypothetical protein